MKHKKLLISLAIVAVVVVIVVVFASVFAIKEGFFLYHEFAGDLTAADQAGGVPSTIIDKIAKGKSTVFLSKENLLKEVNKELSANYPDWYAFAVVKNFPNVLEVHLVRVTAIAKLKLSTGYIYLDSFGRTVDESAGGANCIDITSAFVLGTLDPASEQPQDGTFKFAEPIQNKRLGYVLQAIMATWQCYVEIGEMKDFLKSDTPFEFNTDGSLLIHPGQGGTIEIQSPGTKLAEHLQKAYSVYYNPKVDLQGDDWVITVLKSGKIKTKDPSKN